MNDEWIIRFLQQNRNVSAMNSKRDRKITRKNKANQEKKSK